MTDTTGDPICEECDTPMHQWAFDKQSGWACQGCGWSFDNETVLDIDAPATPSGASLMSACSWCSADYEALAGRLRAAGWTVTAPGRCPRCNSPDPKKHPAVALGGEVNICPHPFHGGRQTGDIEDGFIRDNYGR